MFINYIHVRRLKLIIADSVKVHQTRLCSSQQPQILSTLNKLEGKQSPICEGTFKHKFLLYVLKVPSKVLIVHDLKWLE